ncbi:uncharacterized protein [Periplaneta americana]|uniref:uncharacterized protein n=1 Tax=Periplaneta americana TaxID=6978 RepID=UPI0037E74E8D
MIQGQGSLRSGAGLCARQGVSQSPADAGVPRRPHTDTMMARAVVLVVAALVAAVLARPDSAGIVEMVNGLAYGGIPYGSVTGQVAEYYRQRGTPADLELGRTLYDDFLTYGNFIAG